MKVILFGATGMIGQGVLLECLDAADVSKVLAVGRTPSGASHAKFEEILHPNLLDFAPIAERFRGYDACFFCLGISSAGLTEAEYTRTTYDLAIAAAQAIVGVSPDLTFCFVSGAGTDEHGRSMWARVKGRTEKKLRELPFRAAYMFRPGIVQPLRGIQSKTRSYRILYAVLGPPLFPLIRALSPGAITTTERIGRAMLAVARSGSRETILENPQINALGA